MQTRARSGLSAPLRSAPAEGFTVNTDVDAAGTVICPHSFWLTRVGAKVLSPRWMTPVLMLSALVPGIIGTVWPCTAWTMCEPSPLSYIHWAANACCLTMLTGVLPSLRRVTARGGQLEQLGAGSGSVAMPPADTQSVLGHLRWAWSSLRNWAWLCSALAIVVCVVYGGMNVFWIVRDTNTASIVHDVIQGPLYMVGIPLAIAWFLTLKMSAALVVHAVRNVRRHVVRTSAEAEEWEGEVVPMALILITETLPLLSQGWSDGAAAVCLTCWANAFANIAVALQQDSVLAQSGSLLFAFSMACVPALILFDFADCSTECDLLVKSLNEKRIADTSDETHVKIFKLEVMISHLNKVRLYRQGSTVRSPLVARSIAGPELKKHNCFSRPAEPGAGIPPFRYCD